MFTKCSEEWHKLQAFFHWYRDGDLAAACEAQDNGDESTCSPRDETVFGSKKRIVVNCGDCGTNQTYSVTHQRLISTMCRPEEDVWKLVLMSKLN
jgi:hypothetical protein